MVREKARQCKLVRYQSAFPVSNVFTGDSDVLPRQKTRTHGGTYAKHGRKAQKTLMDRMHTHKIHARPTHIQHTDGRHIKHAYNTLFRCLGNNGSLSFHCRTAVKICFDRICCNITDTFQRTFMCQTMNVLIPESARRPENSENYSCARANFNIFGGRNLSSFVFCASNFMFQSADSHGNIRFSGKTAIYADFS